MVWTMAEGAAPAAHLTLGVDGLGEAGGDGLVLAPVAVEGDPESAAGDVGSLCEASGLGRDAVPVAEPQALASTRMSNTASRAICTASRRRRASSRLFHRRPSRRSMLQASRPR